DTILVTHNRDEAYHMCERLALMDNGHIFSHGNVKSVFSCPKTVAGARITGCKNIAFAQKTGSHSLQIPEWKLALTLPYEIPEALCAVGIRAHAFSIQPTAGPSCHPISVHFCGEMEEPFEWILQFRIQGQDKDTPPIWWRFAKETYPKELPKTLYFQSSDLLLLQA
ncbi:MAG: ABC transporter ATP-binding protein, partial [bacterium]|nr:ABC transporter ATP-binding protein [bacterium]